MTTYRQLVTPNLGVKVNAGWCLQLVRTALGVPAWDARASYAANNTRIRHSTRKMPDAIVPVWFSHWGTYGSGAQQETGEFGHVVLWVPGRGFLSSPGYGFGQEWLSTLEAVEARFRCKFRFWSEDMGGVRVVEPQSTDPLEEIMGYYKNKAAFRKDLGHLIRANVAKAPMVSGYKRNGKAFSEKLADAIRRNYRLGVQNRVKNDRIETKIDRVAARQEQLEKLIQEVGKTAGVAPAALVIDEAAIERVVEASIARLEKEHQAEDAATEEFLAQAAVAEDAEAGLEDTEADEESAGSR